MKRLRTLEGVLLMAGVCLLAIYAGVRLHSVIASRMALRAFAEANPPVRAPDVPPGIDVRLWSDKRVAAFQESLHSRSDIPIAVLTIPKVHLEVPVFDGTDDWTLNRGVGRIAGTAHPGEDGNIGIAGHRDGFFRVLKDVRVGDSLDLATHKATTTYVVDSIQIVRPEDVQVLRKRAVPTVTLSTCYPFYFVGNAPKRYIIQASLQHRAHELVLAGEQQKPFKK